MKRQKLVYESLEELFEESAAPKTKKQKDRKFKKTMGEWKEGELNIGKSDKKVPRTKKGHKQAIAVALSSSGLGNKK